MTSRKRSRVYGCYGVIKSNFLKSTAKTTFQNSISCNPIRQNRRLLLQMSLSAMITSGIGFVFCLPQKCCKVAKFVCKAERKTRDTYIEFFVQKANVLCACAQYTKDRDKVRRKIHGQRALSRIVQEITKKVIFNGVHLSVQMQKSNHRWPFEFKEVYNKQGETLNKVFEG